mmetsp:Transcript_26258/g.37634  ORF Transcript_26258/g.37634 Transcript_26258/m.37634 type:complete len:135 (+) Transcript_26258:596-1000(+)
MRIHNTHFYNVITFFWNLNAHENSVTTGQHLYIKRELIYFSILFSKASSKLRLLEHKYNILQLFHQTINFSQETIADNQQFAFKLRNTDELLPRKQPWKGVFHHGFLHILAMNGRQNCSVVGCSLLVLLFQGSG